MRRKTIRQLSEDACSRMEELEFSGCTVTRYRTAFGRYEDYAREHGRQHHAEDLADGFVREVYGDSAGAKFARRACRVIGYFERTGEIPGRGSKLDAEAPPESAPLLELYIADCARRELSAKTIAARNRDICQFLCYVKRSGASFPDGVGVELLESWAEERHGVAPGNMHRCLSSVRCFLTHLFVIGVTARNLGVLVPRETRYPNKPVVRPWTDEEIAALVDSISDGDSAGKRDKAICLLVVTYGMRSGDVCALPLSALDFDSCTISFVQHKTGGPVELPMTEGVAWALADWLANGRPKQATCREVFTTLRSPWGPMSTIGNVFSKRMEMAGIERVPGCSSGPHSVRHATTTKMVSKGAPLPVVSSVLGHSAENTTMIYLHADVDELRRCALGEGVV